MLKAFFPELYLVFLFHVASSDNDLNLRVLKVGNWSSYVKGAYVMYMYTYANSAPSVSHFIAVFIP